MDFETVSSLTRKIDHAAKLDFEKNQRYWWQTINGRINSIIDHVTIESLRGMRQFMLTLIAQEGFPRKALAKLAQEILYFLVINVESRPLSGMTVREAVAWRDNTVCQWEACVPKFGYGFRKLLSYQDQNPNSLIMQPIYLTRSFHPIIEHCAKYGVS